MPERCFWIRFNASHSAPQLVRAAKVEIHGEHLVFLSSTGELAALYLLEVINDWHDLSSSE